MTLLQIAGVIVLTVWIVESIVFIAGYKHSHDA